VAALLTAKEADLRVQQRYMQIMQRELLDVDLPDFLRDFLSQVWSRVQVAAAHPRRGRFHAGAAHEGCRS
jgi:hypothetical protein